jgi:hypothetical protein
VTGIDGRARPHVARDQRIERGRCGRVLAQRAQAAR